MHCNLHYSKLCDTSSFFGPDSAPFSSRHTWLDARIHLNTNPVFRYARAYGEAIRYLEHCLKTFKKHLSLSNKSSGTLRQTATRIRGSNINDPIDLRKNLQLFLQAYYPLLLCLQAYSLLDKANAQVDDLLNGMLCELRKCQSTANNILRYLDPEYETSPELRTEYLIETRFLSCLGFKYYIKDSVCRDAMATREKVCQRLGGNRLQKFSSWLEGIETEFLGALQNITSFGNQVHEISSQFPVQRCKRECGDYRERHGVRLADELIFHAPKIVSVSGGIAEDYRSFGRILLMSYYWNHDLHKVLQSDMDPSDPWASLQSDELPIRYVDPGFLLGLKSDSNGIYSRGTFSADRGMCDVGSGRFVDR